MNIQHENFVGVYDGFFSDAFCDDLIKYYEWCAKNNVTYSRPESERFKKDQSVCMNPLGFNEISFSYPNIENHIQEFNDTFWNKCYQNYRETYSTLEDYERHTIFTYKLQKTLPSGGYHLWHCEDGSKNFAFRLGVYILYLNNVEEGGETEFLYQSKRVKPQKGRLVIFPPNFPWTHRGNPPLSGDKYIMTGWLEYV